MIINNNIPALNTLRQLGANNNNVQGSLEKLSSGLQINKAGDDAAGLAISEKMRGQIRGLDMASKNAQDGVSLIQTAEGALNESHSILQRMRELAVQSSNDTNTDADRAELQNEVDALAEELSRIADNTEFNTQNLLGGKFEATFHIGANQDQNLKINVDAMDASSLGVGVEVLKEDKTGTFDIDGETVDASDNTVLVDGDGKAVAIEDTESGGGWYAVDDVEVDSTNVSEITAKADAEAFKTTDAATIKGEAGVFEKVGKSDVKDIDLTDLTDVTQALQDSKGNTVALGDNNNNWYAVEDLDLEDTLADNDTAGVTEISLESEGKVLGDSVSAGIDISSQDAANSAVTTIQSAIDTVSSQRSELGAVQNRLEHTINNLGASSENLTAAESRIRDVDMAKEMMEFTKNNILSQASQAMLAQANQMPQGVLQLLQ